MDQKPQDLAMELEAKLKFFVGICLAVTLVGTIGAVLYSLIFVTQPMTGSAPNDEKFFALIGPIATFLTGTLSGIMLGASKAPKEDVKPLPTPPAKTGEKCPTCNTPKAPITTAAAPAPMRAPPPPKMN